MNPHRHRLGKYKKCLVSLRWCESEFVYVYYFRYQAQKRSKPDPKYVKTSLKAKQNQVNCLVYVESFLRYHISSWRCNF